MDKKLVILTSLLTMPLMVFAFNSGGTPNAAPYLSISDLIDIIFLIIWPVVIAFSILSFLVSSVLFMTAQDDPLRLVQARQALLFGIIGVVVAFLAFSVPFIVRNTIGSGI